MARTIPNVTRCIALSAALLATACGTDVQTTSGRAYQAQDRTLFDPMKGTGIDRAVAQAASTEPLLRFPARIGLARIQHGAIVAVPPPEADAWIAFARSHPQYGTYVPINPIVAEMAVSATGDAAHNVIDAIRLGAARQHVDAVLIYSVAGDTNDRASALSLLDLTIVGAYLVPSRFLRGAAVASATLIDVRNGYPYGSATATTNDTGFVASVGSERRAAGLTEDLEILAVSKLTTEVETMMARLQTELDARNQADSHPAVPQRRRVLQPIRGSMEGAQPITPRTTP